MRLKCGPARPTRLLSSVTPSLLALAAACALGATAAVAATTAVPDRSSREPVRLQDSVRLVRLSTAAAVPDGLLTLGLGARTCSTVHLVDGDRYRVQRREVFATAEWSPLPWLAAWAEVPWRTWSGGAGWIPASGGGLGDGLWELRASRQLAGGALQAALSAGGNLPVGDAAAGLGEGVLSPRAGAALTLSLWRAANVPEMRLHLQVARAWNRNESQGYGWGTDGFDPWPTRYPAAGAVGGSDGNDLTTLGAALEFRRGSTALWLEYSADRFPDRGAISPREQFSGVGAGLRWGLQEGWAVHGSYLVSLAIDDAATAWYPSFPDWTMSVGLTRQLGLGGRDGDGDGRVDRRDRCPDLPEDPDGFRDDDGCPDPDNDGDGILDVRDQDPDRPEDFDGFQDHDGAPDPDNDGDGIADADDLCPDEPEDLDGHADDDGCPDEVTDTDGDGVPDGSDACPDLREDRDGFADDDGCPDRDNDLDGIVDEDDGCPDHAEDYDGVQDEDGCPDED